MSTSGNNEDNYDPSEKFKKYEVEYTRYLMKKYFSDKDIFGEKIFKEDAKIGDGIIKSSRTPCFYSYADPVQAFKDQLKPLGSSSRSSADPVHPFRDQKKPLGSSSRSSADPLEPFKPTRKRTIRSSASRPTAEPVQPVEPDPKKSTLDLNADPIVISSDEEDQGLEKVSGAIQNLELAQNSETSHAVPDLNKSVTCPDAGTSSGVPDRKSKSKVEFY